MKKMLIYIILVIAVIILGIIVMKNIITDNKSTIANSRKSEEQLMNNIGIDIGYTVSDNINEDNLDNDLQTEISLNTIDEQDIVDTAMTNEEKAIAIVKKDYGDSTTVYYTIEKDIGSGEFEVSVREKATTKILYRYNVNVHTGEFTSELEAH